MMATMFELSAIGLVLMIGFTVRELNLMIEAEAMNQTSVTHITRNDVRRTLTQGNTPDRLDSSSKTEASQTKERKIQMIKDLQTSNTTDRLKPTTNKKGNLNMTNTTHRNKINTTTSTHNTTTRSTNQNTNKDKAML